MNRKFIIAAAFFSATFLLAQEAPSKLVSGKNGLHSEFVRFEKNAPDFQGAPLLFNEASKQYSNGIGKKIGIETDQLGYETHRFQQTINGIPVEYAMMNVQTKNGKILGETGKWIVNTANPTAVAKQASLSEKIAFQNALNFVGAALYKWQNQDEENLLKSDSGNLQATYLPKGEMVYYSQPNDENLTNLKLAYKFDIYAEEPLSRQYVFVDAKSGEILGTEQLIHETNAPGTAVTGYSGTQAITADKVSATSYRLRETGRAGGTSVETYNLKKGTNYAAAVDFTDTDNNWNNVNSAMDQYATDAHWGAEKTVDYYWAKFGRKSIDNNNFAIKSYVHYSRSYFNAFWDGTRMTYGDGSTTYVAKPLTAIDVCGHEITHGMTSKTANLAYQKESGALNEAFSDIFGNSIEAYARPTKNNWKLGEDFYVIRDMANPNAYGQPDTYLGTKWVSVTGCTPSSANDQCGVHTNSGVANFWYYLLVTGGSGTNDKGFAYSVSGIGFDKAAAIAYRTLTTYLTSASTYANARTYSIQAATDLYGATSNEVTQTKNAWNAVGVGGGTSPAGRMAPDAPLYTVSAVSGNRFIVLANTDVKMVEVINTMGKKVVSEHAQSASDSRKVEFQIPDSELPGVYFVLVNGEKAGSVIKK